MGTDMVVVKAVTSELAIAPEQTGFTDVQKAALQHIGCASMHPADLQVFFHQAQRTGLDPFARQIYMVEYGGKPTIQTGIDGFRLVANRAARRERVKYSKGAPEWADETGTWHSVWSRAKHNGQQPTAARVTVVKDGEQFTAVLMFEEFVARRRDGNPNMMWSTKGAHMLSKCAEAVALRMAFPNDLAGLYTDDEMAAAVREHTVSSRVVSAPADLSDFEPAIEMDTKVAILALFDAKGIPEAEQGSGVVTVVGRSVRGLDDLTEDEGQAVIARLSTLPDATGEQDQ